MWIIIYTINLGIGNFQDFRILYIVEIDPIFFLLSPTILNFDKHHKLSILNIFQKAIDNR